MNLKLLAATRITATATEDRGTRGLKETRTARDLVADWAVDALVSCGATATQRLGRYTDLTFEDGSTATIERSHRSGVIAVTIEDGARFAEFELLGASANTIVGLIETFLG